MHHVPLAVGTLLMAGIAAADGPTFEAASIKVSSADAQPPFGLAGGPGTNDPGRFHAAHTRMSVR